jgi:hypothetical protein
MAGNTGMRVSKYKLYFETLIPVFPAILKPQPLYKYNFPCIGFLACTADAFKTFDGK